MIVYSGHIFHQGADYYFKSKDLRWVYHELFSFCKKKLRLYTDPIYASITKEESLICCFYSIGNMLVISKGRMEFHVSRL